MSENTFTLRLALLAAIVADSAAPRTPRKPQVINDVPNVTENHLFYAMLKNGVQPAQRDVHQHSRRSINDRQSVSAS